MKRNFILTCFFLTMFLASGLVNAQVKDVSVTVSPLIEYQWWNKNINLKDNMFYGVRAGFGFGPHFELRAVAEKSFDIQSKLKSSRWNISDDLISKLPDHTVDITRLSGEAKLNILSPTGGPATGEAVVALTASGSGAGRRPGHHPGLDLRRQRASG